MLLHIRPEIVMLALFTVLTGFVNPLAMTAVAQILLSRQANGSLVVKDGVIVGSSLIGQNFASAKYFHSRPSATSDKDPNDSSKTVDAPYNAAASTGSNLGPTSQKLVDRVKAGVTSFQALAGPGPVPADAVTTSASGLDPDVSPANAFAQVPAVARARGLNEAQVRHLVVRAVRKPALGFLSAPRVNVLLLNLALDQLRSS